MSEPIPGSDSEGRQYADIKEMWTAELGETDSSGKKVWYTKAVDYWKQQPATVNGVLGGFEHVSEDDIDESAEFLLPFFGEGKADRVRAIDCGAGVGRIAHSLIIGKMGFAKVDLLEPCDHMLAKARETLPAERLGELLEKSCEDHEFPEATYDLIVLQWVGIYLTDEDFVEFVRRSRKALRPNGVLFIKENTCASGFVVDKEDSSLTRSVAHYKRLVTEGGGTVAKEGYQQKFPKDLFKVVMIAVQ